MGLAPLSWVETTAVAIYPRMGTTEETPKTKSSQHSESKSE
ncbi:MAG: hypothetical protein ACRC06_05495 [Waterburya sp.]